MCLENVHPKYIRRFGYKLFKTKEGGRLRSLFQHIGPSYKPYLWYSAKPDNTDSNFCHPQGFYIIDTIKGAKAYQKGWHCIGKKWSLYEVEYRGIIVQGIVEGKHRGKVVAQMKIVGEEIKS